MAVEIYVFSEGSRRKSFWKVHKANTNLSDLTSTGCKLKRTAKPITIDYRPI